MTCASLGASTYAGAYAAYKFWFDLIDTVISWVFRVEVGLKVIANDNKPLRVFKSRWNTFDIFVVAGPFLITGDAGSLLVLLRLLRLLRVLKLVKSLPQLAIIVNALIMGLSSIGFIGVILGLFYYLFAILGMLMFQENDPWHFGTLHMAMISLFRASTLEDWTDIMYINLYGCRDYPAGEYDGPTFGTETGCVNNPMGIVAAIYWIVFIIIVYFSKYSDIKLCKKGDEDQPPEYTDASWFSMLFCSGIGVGLFYWGIAEPVSHYVDGTNRYNSNPNLTDEQVAQEAMNTAAGRPEDTTAHADGAEAPGIPRAAQAAIAAAPEEMRAPRAARKAASQAAGHWRH